MATGMCMIVPEKETLGKPFALVSPLGEGYCKCYPTIQDFIAMSPRVMRKIDVGFKEPRKARGR